MNRCLIIPLFLTAGIFLNLPLSAISQETARPELEIWPKGKLPAGSTTFSKEQVDRLKARQTEERLTYIQNPTLTVYQPDPDKATGAAVVICPGGGYNILAIKKEGYELAEWFNSIGVTAFVLKYRIPRRTDQIHWEPMQDVQRSIRLVRHQAAKWKIDPNRIGVLGFSAGGHLTLMSGLQSGTKCYAPVDEADQASAAPNFICPIYAAYMGDGYKDNVAELGELITVSPEAPPTFMAVTLDDAMRGAQAALLLVELKKANVPSELHVYAKGGHGYGIRDSEKPVSTWHHRLEEWLKSTEVID